MKAEFVVVQHPELGTKMVSGAYFDNDSIIADAFGTEVKVDTSNVKITRLGTRKRRALALFASMLDGEKPSGPEEE